MKKKSLLIIGAGASGLMAANELAAYFDITVLEALQQTGGRINSLLIEQHVIETGAEFIHGKLPLTFKILKQAGIKAVPLSGRFYRKHNGKFSEQYEMLKGWDKLLRRMKRMEEDMSLNQFLSIQYAGDKNADFRRMITSYAGGFDLANPDKASVKSLYAEWSAEEDAVYRVAQGYGSLVNYLRHQAEKKGCKILTGKPVKKIDWEKDKVNLITNAGENFEADKLLVTVPLDALQKLNTVNAIGFSPSIEEYKDAACNIGYGSVIRVLVKFKEAFWQKDAGFILSDEKYFPTWWTQLPDPAPILTGWCGGKNAALLSREPEDKILSIALESLAAIYNYKINELQENISWSKVFNWQINEFVAGGYSYNTVYSETAKKLLNTPVLSTIFFAGEALYTGKSPGTVEAALESGRLAARRIRKSG